MRWLALGLSLCLVGCAGPRWAAAEARLSDAWASPTGHYRIEYSPEDASDIPRVRRAADEALPRLERWGALREPVTIRVMPDHASLEAAARQRGLEWLRAWSRYDEVFLQAPSTWGAASASPAQLTELLLHELTHSVMYQLASDRFGWSRKQIPLWFREGMASYTAEQAYRWVSLEEIARYLERHPGSDLLRATPEMYRDESNLVYGMAHHAFAFLSRRYGDEAVRGVLREMRDGTEFPPAFERAIGISVEAFTRDFTHYVRWRGFRGGRLLLQDARPLGDHPGASGEPEPP
ncbi:hypothetical protein [Melittangium boletus]|uniref:hypothetical protein n=1 Tax=Melittangium boletus TaxID=83453 RepID=UPI001FE63C2D|nr:hypothetical protein [Melittangium boletus]